MSEEIAEAIADFGATLAECLTSKNVRDHNFDPSNIVDVIGRLAFHAEDIAKAITPTGALPMETPGGGRVGCLTEAMIFVADRLSEGLMSISASIDNLADAVTEHKEGQSRNQRGITS